MKLRSHLHRHLSRHRPPVTHHEIIADAVFFIIGAFLATLAVFIFDIHWSFYPGNTIFPPNKYIFTSLEPFYIGALVGGVLGIFLIKLLLLGIHEEQEEISVRRKKS
jgi:hypothetical protein